MPQGLKPGLPHPKRAGTEKEAPILLKQLPKIEKEENKSSDFSSFPLL